MVDLCKKLRGLFYTDAVSRSFSPNCQGDVEITVDSNTISVIHNDLKDTYTIQGLQMMPDTCRGLMYHPALKEIQFTIQVKQVAENNMDMVSDRKRKMKLQDQLVESIQTNQDNCYCRVCGQRLLANKMKFNHIYPLPSEDWSNFTDIWFCHQHDSQSEGDSPEGVSMLPRSHDCHVGDMYFLLDSDHLNKGSVRESPDRICCTRCQTVLGEVSEVSPQNGMVSKNARTVYKLYQPAVTFQELKEGQDMGAKVHNSSLEGSFAQLLFEKSHLYTSFKFLISAKSKEKVTHLLVWLLDLNMHLFQGDLNQESSCILKPTQSMKLLFQAYGIGKNERWKNDALYMQWMKDNSVQQLTLPYTILLDLVYVLVRNSHDVPDSVRHFDDLLISHLRYQDP